MSTVFIYVLENYWTFTTAVSYVVETTRLIKPICVPNTSETNETPATGTLEQNRWSIRFSFGHKPRLIPAGCNLFGIVEEHQPLNQ